MHTTQIPGDRVLLENDTREGMSRILDLWLGGGGERSECFRLRLLMPLFLLLLIRRVEVAGVALHCWSVVWVR